VNQLTNREAEELLFGTMMKKEKTGKAVTRKSIFKIFP